ncbi:MAG: hypothetical protein ABXS92_07430 [Sulfurimonas sp.]
MKHLFNQKYFRSLFTLLLLCLLIKFFWVVVAMVWLPAKGIDPIVRTGGKPLYYKVKLTSNRAAVPVKKKVYGGNIKDIKLLAVYNASDATVVTVIHKGRTEVLSKGEALNGFVLERAGSNFATFGKGGKNYDIYLKKGKSGSTYRNISPAAGGVKREGHVSSVPEGEVTDAGEYKIVDRSLVKYYTQNIGELSKNISLQEVKKRGKTEGFKVRFIRKNSLFEKLGLQRNDMIKSVNGQILDSYQAGVEIYRDIQDSDNMTLVIIRGEEEMELEYEVN